MRKAKRASQVRKAIKVRTAPTELTAKKEPMAVMAARARKVRTAKKV